MSIFGWSYPPGAANDPMAPYNQDAIEPDDETHEAIRTMVTDLVGEDSTLGGFYRSVYEATSCGPSIGFEINGQPHFNEDLYQYPTSANFWDTHIVSAISVSSIVEGSNVEIDTVWIEGTGSNTSKVFWQTVEEVNAEAEWYWVRDNSEWFLIEYQQIDKPLEIYSGRITWGEVEWDNNDSVPSYVRDKVSQYNQSRSDDEFYLGEEHREALGLGVNIQFYVNDMTFSKGAEL